MREEIGERNEPISPNFMGQLPTQASVLAECTLSSNCNLIILAFALCHLPALLAYIGVHLNKLHTNFGL